MDPQERQLRALKERLAAVQASLRPSIVSFRSLDEKGRPITKREFAPAPAPGTVYFAQQEALRNQIVHEMLELERAMGPRVRLAPAPVVQVRDRAPHCNIPKRRPSLTAGRKSCPADRPDIASIWVRDHQEEVIVPLVRDEVPEDRLKESTSALRPLQAPFRRKFGQKTKRAPFDLRKALRPPKESQVEGLPKNAKKGKKKR